MTVFADTLALIAWLNPRDNAHAVVAAYLDGFTGRLVTTEWVLMELADALSAPEARATVVAFLQAVRADPLLRQTTISSKPAFKPSSNSWPGAPNICCF